jgi:hypothetical protein
LVSHAKKEADMSGPSYNQGQGDHPGELLLMKKRDASAEAFCEEIERFFSKACAIGKDLLLKKREWKLPALRTIYVRAYEDMCEAS